MLTSPQKFGAEASFNAFSISLMVPLASAQIEPKLTGLEFCKD
jgi:hypothetical protein